MLYIYFHELCTDLNYIAPVDVVVCCTAVFSVVTQCSSTIDVVVGSEIEVPEIPEGVVWKIKVLATLNERLRVLMASHFGFGRNMLRF